jgi:hypothetical protein
MNRTGNALGSVWAVGATTGLAIGTIAGAGLIVSGLIVFHGAPGDPKQRLDAVIRLLGRWGDDGPRVPPSSSSPSCNGASSCYSVGWY